MIGGLSPPGRGEESRTTQRCRDPVETQRRRGAAQRMCRELARRGVREDEVVLGLHMRMSLLLRGSLEARTRRTGRRRAWTSQGGNQRMIVAGFLR